MRIALIALGLALAACDPIDLGGAPLDDRAPIRFTPVESGADARLLGVWGSGPDDVWFVGSAGWTGDTGVLLRWQGERLTPSAIPDSGENRGLAPRAVAGTGPDDVWVVGSSRGTPTVLRFDGSRWAYEPRAGFDLSNRYGSCVAVDDDGVVWVGSGYGAVWRWDGAFDPIEPPWDSPFFRGEITGIWAAGPDDAWAVGLAPYALNQREDYPYYPGSIMRWDGARWTFWPTDFRAYGVWGAAADDVWAVGFGGAPVAHWDGRLWRQAHIGVDATLSAVHGTASDDIWAVGRGGVIAHWDGAAWRRRPRERRCS